MGEPNQQATSDSGPGRSGPGRWWVRWLVGLSIAAGIVGMGLHAAQLSRRGERAAADSTSEVDGVRSILPRRDEPGQTREPETRRPTAEVSPWWPALGRLGLGFFAGFCVAYTLKAFVKLTVILAGLALVGLIALQQTGAITVDWAVVESWLADGWEVIQHQFASLQSFVTGLIPTSTSAVAGAAIGVIKK